MTKEGVSSRERTEVNFVFEQPLPKMLAEAGCYRTVPEKLDESFLLNLAEIAKIVIPYFYFFTEIINGKFPV